MRPEAKYATHNNNLNEKAYVIIIRVGRELDMQNEGTPGYEEVPALSKKSKYAADKPV